MLVGGLVSGFVGLLTGALTLRLRGIYAAVMAWFVGLALMGIVRNVPDITRGSLGLAVPSLLESSDNLPYYYETIHRTFAHDVWRRASANWLAGLVARSIIDRNDAREMMQDLAVNLARRAYHLD